MDAAREKKEGEDGDDEQVAAPIVEDIEEEQDRGDDVQPAPGPVALKCCVMLQKEGPEGLYDEECGAISPDKMAGLCEYETNCCVTFEAFFNTCDDNVNTFYDKDCCNSLGFPSTSGVNFLSLK